MRKVLHGLRAYLPGRTAVRGTERLRACCGAMLAVILTGATSRLLLGPGATTALVAPMGASAVLLFALPASPLAQPWSIIGGNIISAAVGVACAHAINDPLIAAALALPLAIAAMFALRCLHPPGGAMALTAVLGGPAVHAAGFAFVLSPVGLNSLLMTLVALIFNNATRHRYPHLAHPDHSNTHGTRDALPRDRLGFTPADLDDVLKQYNEVLDISRDDLESLFLQTEMHAYRRRFGEITCADIMSRDVVTVESGTALEEAWSLLRKHKVKALPVVDSARCLIGIVTFVDFMKHANLDVYHGFDVKLRQFIRRSAHRFSNKPEVVGQIMTRTPRTARADMHIVNLVPLLSDVGLHHIPIVDGERRLAGMVTQSDLIAALYRGRLADTAQAA
ncbi:MAG TPA: HPP family protein [Noviherbaspirillum sp.]|uniref:HPP family protein n=1 Tax=Noviherbaspirillum sp. TaxID=1926288 RepID=UPI002B46CE36|nr:HPP family protein [Noviherbaspirillum sp.]HJV88533.1 HPP family protein [Noviherbaspirillum sp.]